MRRAPRRVLAAACLLHALVIGGGTMSLPPLLARLAEAGMPAWRTQLAWALIPLGAAATVRATPRLLHRYGAARLAATCATLAAIAIATRAAPALPALWFGGMALYGAATGVLLAALTDLVGRAFQASAGGLAQAAFFGAYALGAALSVATAAPLATALGDPASHLVFAALALAALPACAGLAGSPAPAAPAPHGATAPSVARFCLAYGLFVGGYLGLSGLLPLALRHWGASAAAADGSLAAATLGFVLGAGGLGAAGDRFGQRATLLRASLLAAGACAALIPPLAARGATGGALLLVCLFGVTAGGTIQFFPVLLGALPPGASAAAPVARATFASYVGGFAVPVLLAPLAAPCPALALSASATLIATAALLVPRAEV